MNRELWVYDVETLKSCFTYSAINVDTQEIVQFVLHKDRWEISQLMKHLFYSNIKGQIGFNNLNFDYPILHFIYKNANNSNLVELIYQEAQRIIEEQNRPEFNSIVAIKQSEVLIPQLDLFKMWHYNNKARATS